jgi:hypothetical protein
MRAVKQFLWMLLAIGGLWFVHRLILGMFVYPYGGGEFHSIFAYSGGGRLDVALRVLATYIGLMCVLVVALVALRFPLPWLLVALAGTAVCVWSWWLVCSFPYQSDTFHTEAVRLLPFVPLPILLCCWITQRLRQAVAQSRKVPKATPDEVLPV